MECQVEQYLQKHPYRKKYLNSAEGKFLLQLLEKKTNIPPESYWKRFGYELGGPVCYGYVKWIIDEIEQRHPDISDLAFVARDGWLLKKVFHALPHKPGLKSHYIYAPRTMNVICQNEEAHTAYRQYLSEQEWGGGTVAVIDTVTMKFSSQQLLASSLTQGTYGFFWLVLNVEKGHGKTFQFSTYQSARYHTIRCWNLMEFIMTSPEAPICAMEGSKPLYRTPNPFEKQRNVIFTEIEAGVMKFVQDVCQMGHDPVFTNSFITEWVNDFLLHPDQNDISMFEGIMVSEREDHSDCIPMEPFKRTKELRKGIKDCIWLFSQKYKYLYRILHFGNSGWKRVKTFLRGSKCLTFRGEKPWELVDKLATYDVVSFDIFDTLIIRDVDKPTDLFYRLEEKNGLPAFHDNRIRAEMDARRSSGKPNGEIDIFDIYQELSRYYSLDVNQRVREELAAEKMICHANPAIKELYRLLVEKGCRMIAVSDMYIPEKYLCELLEECGYTKIRQVYVSCDHGVGKGNGALQKLVQSELGDKLHVIHIGDNFASDVRGSELAGWNAVQLLLQQ